VNTSDIGMIVLRMRTLLVKSKKKPKAIKARTLSLRYACLVLAKL